LVLCPLSTIRRTVWDGDQELMEIQQPGYTGATDAVLENDTAFAAPIPIYRPGDVALDLNWFYGRVAYTFGPTLDQPLSLTRWAFQRDSAGGQTAKWVEPFTIVPHWNVRGGPDNGAFANGATRNCNSPAQTFCVALQWPFGWTAHEQKFFQPRMWNGSLLEEKRDGSGLVFKRNRYLDPATGKFTQEDPIGLAGGMNLYGFAGGDPVNLSDPFGLQVGCKGYDASPRCIAAEAEFAASMRGKSLGQIASENAPTLAATAGVFAMAAGPAVLTRLAPYIGSFIGAGKVAADSRTTLAEGQGLLSIVRDGQIIAQTGDFLMSHPRLVEKTFGSGGLPPGTWVGTVGKVAGQITALNSKTVMGNQLPAPATIQDLFRSIFK
jgi:RHS repeat-associated protein